MQQPKPSCTPQETLSPPRRPRPLTSTSADQLRTSRTERSAALRALLLERGPRLQGPRHCGEQPPLSFPGRTLHPGHTPSARRGPFPHGRLRVLPSSEVLRNAAEGLLGTRGTCSWKWRRCTSEQVCPAGCTALHAHVIPVSILRPLCPPVPGSNSVEPALSIPLPAANAGRGRWG